MNQRLAQFLDESSKEGEKESEGQFSLHIERALPKLQKFQLLEPREYVLSVVAAASLAGATGLNIDADADDCFMEFRGGATPSRTELEGLLPNLLASQRPRSDRYLSELARAVIGAGGLRPKAIRVLSWRDGEGWELCLRGEQQLMRPVPRCPWADGGHGVVLHVKERLSLQTANRFLGQMARADLPEGHVLIARCRHALLPITWNGTEINRPFDLGECSKVLNVDAPPSLRAVWRGPDDLRWPGQGLQGWFAAGLNVRWGKMVLFLVNGVGFVIPPKLLGCERLRGVVLADDLQKDLSQTNLVENGAFTDLVEGIRPLVRSHISLGVAPS